MGLLKTGKNNPAPVGTTIVPPDEIKRAIIDGLARHRQQEIAHDQEAAAYLAKIVTPQFITENLFQTIARNPRSSYVILSLHDEKNPQG